MVKKKCPKELYCRFLIAAQSNYTATNFSTLVENTAHDAITGFLSGTKLTPSVLWEYSKQFVNLAEGVLIPDDGVLDHPFGKRIGLAKRQYSGTHHDAAFGIGVETPLWSSSTDIHEHIPTDFRICHPSDDGKTKNDQARDMLQKARDRGFKPALVTMDSFYAPSDNLHLINDFDWIFVAGVKSNGVVFTIEDGKATKYPVSTVTIPEGGIIVHLKDYGKVKLFKSVAQDSRICFCITDNPDSSESDVREAYAIRWRVEEYHRGLKQTVGIESCQSRIKRAQGTHIFCSILSFPALEKKRLEEQISRYEAGQKIVSDALFLYLKSPMIPLPVKT